MFPIFLLYFSFTAALLLILAHVKKIEQLLRENQASNRDEIEIKPLDEGMNNLAKFEEQLNDRDFRRAMVCFCCKTECRFFYVMSL